MNRRSILAAYKKKSSHFQTGVTGFKSGNLFKRYPTISEIKNQNFKNLLLFFYFGLIVPFIPKIS